MKNPLIFLATIFTIMIFGQTKNPNDFLPKGYVVFDKIYGDLNNDGLEDLVFIIQGTNRKNFVVDNEYNTGLLLNRRGIIILFNKKGKYELALKNYNCFSSQNEESRGYIQPELSIAIYYNNLFVEYGYGRYGWWKYNFRFQNSDFELIGYENSDNHGPVSDSQTSINFLTKKKLYRKNTNQDAQTDGDEIFKETWTNLKRNKLIKLSKIKDFDELDFSEN